MIRDLNRRSLLRTFSGITILALTSPRASAAAMMIVHRDPGCGCCEEWVKHIRASGIEAIVIDEEDMSSVKKRLGVPDTLASCHTAEIGGYVVEGHVPANAILSLLREQPAATGLAAPGMPIGSPGMESGERKEVFEVILFGNAGASIFGRYRGGEPT